MPRADPHLKRCLQTHEELLELERKLHAWVQGLCELPLDRDEPWTPGWDRRSADHRPERPGFDRPRHEGRKRAVARVRK